MEQSTDDMPTKTQDPSISSPNTPMSSAPLEPALSELKDTTCLFMALPAELRNMIYNELWMSTPTIFANFDSWVLEIYYNGHKLNPDIRSYTDTDHRLPVWLQVCKMFLLEGLNELHNRSTWTVNAESRSLHDPTDRSSALLDFRAVSRGVICIDEVVIDRDDPQCMFFKIENKRPIRALFEKGLGENVKLRWLRLICIVDDLSYEPDDLNVQSSWISLHPIDKYNLNLDRFEVEVDVWTSSFEHIHPSENGPFWSFFSKLLAEEVKAIGRKFVGEDGVLHVKKVHINGSRGHSLLFTFAK
jgi:hypothetical protein